MAAKIPIGSHSISDEVDGLMLAFKAEILHLYEKQLATDRDQLQDEMVRRCSRSLAENSVDSTGTLPHRSLDNIKQQPATLDKVDQESQIILDVKHDWEAACRPSFSLMTEELHAASPHSEAPSPTSSTSLAELNGRQRSVSVTSTECQQQQWRLEQYRLEQRRVQKFYCLVKPNSLFALIWALVSAIVTAICLWGDTLSAVDSFPGGYGPLGFWWEVFILVVFLSDIILNFNTAVEDKVLGVYNRRRLYIAKNYLQTWFLFDAATSIPWGLIDGQFVSGRLGRLGRFAKILKVLKAFRLGKIMKLMMNHDRVTWLLDSWDAWLCTILATEDGSDAMLKLTRFALAVLKLLLVIYAQSHILTCSLLANRENPNMHWSYDGVAASDMSVWERYAVAVCWTTKVLATGQEDWHGLVFAERNMHVLIFLAIVACLYADIIIFALAIFTNMKGSEDMDFGFKMRLMNWYLRKQDRVTSTTRRKILGHFKAQRTAGRQKFLRSMIGEELSPHLRHGLLTDIYGVFFDELQILNQFPFTQHLTYVRLLSKLCTITTTEFFLVEEKIISSEINPACMFFLISGFTLVHHNDTITRTPSGNRLRDREHIFFAVECLFTPAGIDTYLPYDVIAAHSCELGKITREAFDVLSLQFPPRWREFINFIRLHVESGEIIPSKLHQGLDSDMMLKFKQWNVVQQNIRSTNIEDLGVRCTYLVDEFKADLYADLCVSVGQLDLASTSFSDLSIHFWTGGVHRGFRGSAEKVCPRDGLKGSSIVDALDEHEKGMATHYVSWCWGYAVDTMVSALSNWATAQHVDLSQCCFWICFFCNNQRKLLVNQEPNDLLSTFANRLNRIGNLVMVFDKYRQPLYTSRIWCIYEAFTARKYDIQSYVALPGSCQKDFRRQLMQGSLVDISKSLTNISVESAEATYASDRDHILRLIKTSIGFAAVNESVKCALMSWLTTAFHECLQENITSETAHFVTRLILEGTGNASEFNCNDWKVAIQRHPGLLELFEFKADQSAEQTFNLLSGDAQRVNIQVLDSELERRKKNTIVALAKWLQEWTPKDSELEAIRDDVFARVREETLNLEGKLKESKTVMNDLGRKGSFTAM